jgi:hypothetical protein
MHSFILKSKLPATIIILENTLAIFLRTFERGRPPTGSFYLVKGKAFETGREISNLENASCNLIHIPLNICKKTLKRFSKRICKNKTSGAKVVQNVKQKKAIHSLLFLVRLSYWFNSK